MNNRFLQCCCLMAVMLFSTVSINAASPKKIGNFYFTFSGSEATVTAKSKATVTAEYTGSMAIPSTIVDGGKTYTVTAIDEYAFYQSKELTDIVIPSTVTTISRLAFYKCGALKVMDIPNSVVKIGESAFSQCKGLKKVTIGSGVKTIDADAFNGCTMDSVIINAVTPPVITEGVFTDKSFALMVPNGTLQSYQDNPVWGLIKNIKQQTSVIAEGLSFSKAKKFILVTKQTSQAPVLVPSDAQNSYVWSSSDTAVATVDNDGLVTGLSKGVSVITAATIDGSSLTASYKIYVFEPGLPGDMNGDGDITIADANAIVNLFVDE